MNIQTALLGGLDIPVPELSLVIHSPTLKEIAMFGEDEYFEAIGLILLDKAMFNSPQLENVHNFVVLRFLLDQTPSKKEQFLSVLDLFFPSYKITLREEDILFLDITNNVSALIDMANFDQFQEVMRIIISLGGKNEQIKYNPVNDKAKEIERKLLEGRKKLADIKKNSGIIMKLVSTLVVGLHFTYDQMYSLNMFQLFDMLERYNLYTCSDIDLKVRLAGGKPSSQPENWMKNIH